MECDSSSQVQGFLDNHPELNVDGQYVRVSMNDVRDVISSVMVMMNNDKNLVIRLFRNLEANMPHDGGHNK